ncbi:MAG: MBL fold metallo-hydrolase [Gemmatimonadaceae bacterium]
MPIPALFIAALLGSLPSATDSAPHPFDYATEQIAPNVWAFLEKRPNPMVSSNIVAVVGSKSVLVFDSGHHPSVTRAIIGDIKRLTDKPVRYLVISHWHDDHWIGNAEFVKAFPDIKIISHEFTAKTMETRKGKIGGTACKEEILAPAKPLREALASGKRSDGTTMSEASRERITNFLEAIDAHVIECDAMDYRGIDSVTSKSMSIDLGGRRVNLKYLGRGNTAGDLVAYVPDAKTVVTGDLVVYPFPFATQSYISEWAKVLRQLQRLDATNVVPGHGAVMHDMHYVSDVAETLESIAKQSREKYHAGMTAEELRAAVDLSAFSERFSHGDAFVRDNFVAQMNLAVDRMWQELSGKWKPEGI